MGILSKNKGPKLSRAAMLASRPTRNESLRWENNDNGEVQVSIKRQDTWKVRLLSKFFYIPRQRKITLDEVGSEVWRMCNGRNSVGRMIEELSDKYQLNRKEAEVSLLQYLKTLGQKRFIGFVLESDEKPPGRGAASGKKWQKKQTGASN
ncbi:MAG: PqqD family protein [Gemmatimonadetes bacterium]|nr:PqqD family protein [Gemmatimonadota bacterium]MYC72537.1 PqqD family protein [Gemmatimonadota bacterium]